ncbi:hypothetical protein PEPS_11420 [Persicobacter psychrovividus]|uniref:Uncharacterized protein n=2 Tax=Persicobacter psychrovividus TaxID=387638 RepID=A0ABM7VD67_9BACT|nr:hypothetical protein PEPS_11420 [Persicobacter psychrovividus]
MKTQGEILGEKVRKYNERSTNCSPKSQRSKALFAEIEDLAKAIGHAVKLTQLDGVCVLKLVQIQQKPVDQQVHPPKKIEKLPVPENKLVKKRKSKQKPPERPKKSQKISASSRSHYPPKQVVKQERVSKNTSIKKYPSQKKKWLSVTEIAEMKRRLLEDLERTSGYANICNRVEEGEAQQTEKPIVKSARLDLGVMDEHH